MLTEASAAISGIKTALEIAKGIAALKSAVEINQAIIDIQRTLLEAQGAALSDKEEQSRLQEEIRELKHQISRQEEWNNIAEQYTLTRSPMGCYTYDLKQDGNNTEVFHRICPSCFNDKVKSILQTLAASHGGETLICLRCNNRLQITEFNTPRIEYRNPYY